MNDNPDALKKSLVTEMCQRICPPPEITISCPVNNETENLSSSKIIETPKVLRHSTRSNLELIRKASNENRARLYPVLHDNDLSPILSTSDDNNKENINNNNQVGNKLLVNGKNINSPDSKENSQLSRDVKSALATLENVISDNLNNTSLTFDPSAQSTTEFTASDLISPERTPLFQRIVNRFSGKKRTPLPSIADNDGGGGGDDDNDDDEPMNNRNSTLNRSTKLYKSFSRKLKDGLKSTLGRNERSAVELSPEVLEQMSFSKIKSGEIDKIILKIKVEQEAINQARKALVHCHSNIEFLGSKAEIESERILLIAGIKKDLLTDKLRILSGKSNEILDNDKKLSKISCADITIDKICLTLKNFLRKKPNHGDVADWFVAVITEGNDVWASSPATCKIDNPIIEFDKLIVNINNLRPSFKIKIEIYNLKLKTGRNYDDSVKRHFNYLQLSKSSVCPSPTRFLRKHDRSLAPKISRVTCTSFPTSFQLSGYTYLTVKDINLSAPWILNGVPNDSLLLGTIHLNLSAKINITVCHKGFLTQCGETGGVPTRDVRWCVLNERKLSLWKYKDDEEEKSPLMTINLNDCITKKIGVTNETLCAKPRTMLIETKREKNINDCNSMIFNCTNEWTIVRHFLSCDTKKDLDEWIYKLNYALSLIHEWNDDSVSQFSPLEASVVSEL